MRKKVLWIEDDAFNELGMLATPVHLTGEFQLVHAVSATEAVDRLYASSYDAVVVDIRLPPGDDPRWISLYNKAGGSNKSARLGVRLLQHLFSNDAQWTARLQTKDKRRYGVLSMDRWDDIEGDLRPIGVTLYHNKSRGADRRVLLKIIREILAQCNGGDYI